MRSNDLARTVSPGSESRADADREHPGTWEILPTPTLRTGGDTERTTPGPERRRVASCGEVRKGTIQNQQREGRYRDVKETKRTETEGKKS